ncbi:MAG: A24 family peptidase [Pseudomonadota bacterium]
MIPAEVLAAASGLAVFLGHPLAHWAAKRLVGRIDAAWQASSLEWLETQGIDAPEAPEAPSYPEPAALPWRLAFSFAAALLGYGAGGVPMAAMFTCMCLIAAAAARADLRAQVLPDLLVGALGLLGILMVVTGGGPAPRDAMIGLAAGGAAFWTLSRGYAVLRGREGLGLGDVKLFAVSGLIVGWAYLPFVALTAVLVTIVSMAAAGAAAWSGQSRTPFGPGIAIGLMVVLGSLRLGISPG